MAAFGRWVPAKLKHRLAVSFLIVVIVPFCLFQLLYYGQLEDSMKQNISLQNNNHLQVIRANFESLKFEMLRGVILFERNRSAMSMLTGPDSGDPEARQRIGQWLDSSFGNVREYQDRLKVVLVDREGAATAYRLWQEPSNVETFAEGVGSCRNGGVWQIGGPEMSAWGEPSSTMSMCLELQGESNRQVGSLYFLIDLNMWLKTIVSHLSVKQNYFMIGTDGTIAAGTGVIEARERDGILARIQSKPDGYYLDRASSSVVTYTYLPSIDRYLVSRFELGSIIGDLSRIRNDLITVVAVFALIFIVVAYVVSSTVTRPIRLLQFKMNQTAKTNLKVHIPENGYKGEVLDLCRSFNAMVADVNELVQRLKLEERQKEAIHFKMLLSQMNPHFLFNTLNTIKWNAVDRDDDVTAAICAALGSLLETSLNTDIDLIYLQEELELIRAYIYIQQLRHPRRFEMRYDIDKELHYALVPKLSLQPLVENAIIHGFARTLQDGVIVIRASRADRAMVIDVSDNGCGPEEAVQRRSRSRSEGGVGLSNLRERLRLLFRDEARLELSPLAPGTRVRITIPLLLSNPYNLDEKEEDRHVDRSPR